MLLTLDTALAPGTYRLSPEFAPLPVPLAPPLQAGDHVVDLSRHNSTPPKRPINYALLKAHTRAVVHRATLGGNGLDDAFLKNWPLIREHFPHHGVYHLFIKDADPDRQANHLLAVLEGAGGGYGTLPVVIDVEPRSWEPALPNMRDTTVRLLQLLASLTEALKYLPLIYTAEWVFGKQFIERRPELAQYPLWSASYPTAPGKPLAYVPGISRPFIPKPWIASAMWQWSGGQENPTPTVPGVDGACDQNVVLDPERLFVRI